MHAIDKIHQCLEIKCLEKIEIKWCALGEKCKTDLSKTFVVDEKHQQNAELFVINEINSANLCILFRIIFGVEIRLGKHLTRGKPGGVPN